MDMSKSISGAVVIILGKEVEYLNPEVSEWFVIAISEADDIS